MLLTTLSRSPDTFAVAFLGVFAFGDEILQWAKSLMGAG